MLIEDLDDGARDDFAEDGTEDFDDGARDDFAEGGIEDLDVGVRDHFAVDVVAGVCVPRNSVRGNGGARAGSVIVEASVTVDGHAEAAAAFASSLADPAKPLVDEFHFGPCAVSGVPIEESAAAAAAPAEVAPTEEPTEPSPSPAPAVTDNNPLRLIGVIFHDDDGKRRPEEEIEGRDGGLRDYAVTSGQLDDEGEEAVRQDPCAYVAPWDSGGASAATAAATVGLGLELQVGLRLQLLRRMVGGEFHAERSVKTGVLTRREESPSPPAPGGASATGRAYDVDATYDDDPDSDPHGMSGETSAAGGGTGGDGYKADTTFWGAGSGGGAVAAENVWTRREESPSPPVPGDASTTGRTYDDITKAPPPHLRCVVSPLSSLPPVLRCTAASLSRFPPFSHRRPGG